MPSPIQLFARARITPDRVALVQQVSKLVSDEMLEQIARADYGHDARAHLKTLRFIRDGGLPAKLSWQEREVLELVRWSRPEDEAAHTMRLFACALLVTDGDPLGDAEIQTLAPLLESLLVLGKKKLIDAAAGLLLFRIETAGSESRPFFALSLLLLLALNRPAELQPEEWEALSAWVIEEESASRAASGFSTGVWLLDSTYWVQSHALWLRLGERLLRAPPIAGLELLLVGLREWAASRSEAAS